MSYLRFLTIKTFIKHNPDWKIILWYPKFPSTHCTWKTGEQKYTSNYTDYFNKVQELPLVTKTPVDFEEYGINNKMSEVHKSDFLRIQQLSTTGGVWSDMDILYLKPMSSLYFNTEDNKDIETVYSYNPQLQYGHSVGFLMATENNKFFKELLLLARKSFNPNDYQCMGVNLFNQYYPTFESINKITPAINLLMDVVYPYNANQLHELITDRKTKYTVKPKISSNTIGIHWYAGSRLWKGFMSKTNGGLINLPNSIMGDLLKNENQNG